jgi:acyl-CoA reductase-like NAD-dependent aldehyde dehydrogenase
METVLDKLGIADENPGVFDGEWRGSGSKIDKISPIDGRRLASVHTASEDDYNKAIMRAGSVLEVARDTGASAR